MTERRLLNRIAVPVTCVCAVALLVFSASPQFGETSPQPGDIREQNEAERPPSTGPGATMVVVPAGEFVMGGQPLDVGTQSRVVFLPAFAIDRTEVTNADFAAFVRETGYLTVAEQHGDARSWRTYDRSAMANLPVVFIAWDDANAYCVHAGKRLPTEAEWEKAARGADARLWPWGNEWDGSKTNSMERGQMGTTAVGAFAAGASPYGLVDMAGNVWEWTASAYADGENLELQDSADARTFRDAGVLRGGSWRTMTAGTQVTYRKPAAPDYRRDTTGFRCADDAP
jgi:formylglycine-generating enzyme required for sulfatase activity